MTEKEAKKQIKLYTKLLDRSGDSFGGDLEYYLLTDIPIWWKMERACYYLFLKYELGLKENKKDEAKIAETLKKVDTLVSIVELYNHGDRDKNGDFQDIKFPDKVNMPYYVKGSNPDYEKTAELVFANFEQMYAKEIDEVKENNKRVQWLLEQRNQQTEKPQKTIDGKV